MRRWCGGAMVAVVMMVDTASVQAADFVISNGQTVTTTQTLTNGETGVIEPGGAIAIAPGGIVAGDNNTITNGGGILLSQGIGIKAGDGNVISNSGKISTEAVGAHGVSVANSNTITNSGEISTAISGARGIQALNNNAIANSGLISMTGSNGVGIQVNENNRITNSGSISMTNDNATGIQANENNRITNSGAISTTGSEAKGIVAAINNTITNNGTIATTGLAADGISVTDNNTIINAGRISTTGRSAEGIAVGSLIAFGNDNTIINSGAISVTGVDSNAVNVFGQRNTIINSGVISATGANSNAVFSFLANNTIINSGVISATGANSNAVNFADVGHTLRLLPGSVIVGPLNFSPGNTLDVANGLSINNTFTGNAPAVVANGAPFVVSGLQVAVVDPTALVLADDIFYDLTNTVTSNVLSRLSTAAGRAVAQFGSDGLSFVSSMDVDRGAEAWVSVFGLSRDQRATSPAAGADHDLGGIVAGLDGQLAPDTRAGFFLGGSTSTLDVKFNSQDEDIDSVFGGVYGSYASGPWAFDLVVTGGRSRYDLTRNIANNTAPGGLEKVAADYDGYFIAPELSVARAVWINGRKVVPSVRLGYAGARLDGYKETGSTSGMTVDDRLIHLLTGRFQMTMPVSLTDSVYVAPYAGIEGRRRLGDSDVGAVLLGQNINIDMGGGDSDVGAVLAGVELSMRVDGGVSLFGRVEAMEETNGGRTIAGQAGLRIMF